MQEMGHRIVSETWEALPRKKEPLHPHILRTFLGPRLRGQTSGDKRQSAIFCTFLRKSVVFCEVRQLRRNGREKCRRWGTGSAFPKCFVFEEKARICKSQRKSAKICVWPRFVPLSALRTFSQDSLDLKRREVEQIMGRLLQAPAFPKPLLGGGGASSPSCFLPRVANASAPHTGQKPPRSGKERFRGQKTPISHRPRQGPFESKKSPFLYRAPQGNGTQSALS